MASPENPSITSHAEIHIEGKKEKWSGGIEIPKETTPFSKLSEDLSAIEPQEIWTEEPMLDEDMDYEDTLNDDTLNEIPAPNSEITQ